ncbi:MULTISPECIES: DNA polymerase III subunit delta [unclassified Campylobacter]|uniref:DNA polymerase III subunit delta n=1 Tax=unclassified Campylobacter TaxID=2593542 RepID=UPI001237F58A|nr:MULTISPECIES: DNA polymerase III subunit delta [unclassified Campylobacter]KAA6225348.1 DNA polymerase III subunit delta [Campylobacter sp. LR185c]KAA6227044.1 DNA polymerase III subunit delta [Campylobacter sp. LR196d]KAA6227615.1 DNA polymerase III subunit delta [Campylobacter sp. LR286c]KAA6230725.1 DNA polymerase III subunit delta [Campylobacter sp. LR291e]KAA8604960.1 DNA polymerase III subunit delta [Campylobacter sp. LR185c]
MYKKDLQGLLYKDDFPNFFALYGADNFQIELFTKFIKEKFKVDESLKMYFEEYDFNRAVDFLSLGSLFSTTKLLELKLSKKPASKELNNLVELCKKNKDNFFILELYDENSKQNDLEKAFETNFVRFFKPNSPREAIELLELKAKDLNVNVTQNALFALYEIFDENLYLAASELAKFQGLNLDENNVKTYCSSVNLGSFESFFDLLLKKADIRIELEKILDNSNEIAFINSLYNEFYRLFKIALFAKINGRVDLKEILNYAPPPQVAKNLSTLAFSLKLEQYKEIFYILLKTEHSIKTKSNLIKKEFLISQMLKLSRFLKAYK